MALNDYLFSEEFLFEGEQAEEYKKRKAAEKDAAKKADDDYLDKRWKRNASKKGWDMKDDKGDTYTRPGRKMTKQNPNYGVRHPIKTVKGQSADEKAYDRARDKHETKTGKNSYAAKHTFNSKYNSRADVARTDDATYRHARRHPDQYKESVELYDGHIELV